MIHIPRILVSGGGIAGNALALQLARAGVPVTVVERAKAPRPGGQAVDLRGASREVAERMGLMPGIRRHQLDERGMAYVDAAGRVYGRMAMEDFDGKGAVAEIEITRGDLNGVLLDALQEHPDAVEIRYGERLVGLAQDESGVGVTFASGGRERFDLVIGADGLHSATRALAFGPEDRYVRYLGGYAAFFTMPAPADIRPGWFTMRLVPGAMFGLRPDADPTTAKAIINIRAPRAAALRGDRAAQEALIRHAIARGGWHAPGILDAMSRADDFYFDELARVEMPSLVNNRVVLIGDAGTCGSPLTGMGTAMALVAAYLLGREIGGVAASGEGLHDRVALAEALARFERDLVPHLERSRRIPGGSLAAMIPRSRILTAASRINVRILLSRALRPLAKRMFADDGSTIALPDADEALTAPGRGTSH